MKRSGACARPPRPRAPRRACHTRRQCSPSDFAVCCARTIMHAVGRRAAGRHSHEVQSHARHADAKGETGFNTLPLAIGGCNT
eukprot:6641835-Prymnesium_polylepis.1